MTEPRGAVAYVISAARADLKLVVVESTSSTSSSLGTSVPINAVWRVGHQCSKSNKSPQFAGLEPSGVPRGAPADGDEH